MNDEKINSIIENIKNLRFKSKKNSGNQVGAIIRRLEKLKSGGRKALSSESNTGIKPTGKAGSNPAPTKKPLWGTPIGKEMKK